MTLIGPIIGCNGLARAISASNEIDSHRAGTMSIDRIDSTGARDGRTLDHQTHEEPRLRAVGLVNDGKGQAWFARAIGSDPYGNLYLIGKSNP